MSLMPERWPRCGGGVCFSTAHSSTRNAAHVRIGSDPGLIPGLGDLTMLIFAVLLWCRAFVLFRVLCRFVMPINAAIDFLVGCIRVIGDLFDFGWKANVRNLALLERHAHPGSKASRGDWIFVLTIIGILAALAVIPLLFAAWLLLRFRLFYLASIATNV